jgi:hypothetical protein
MTATTATATELGIRLSGERFYAARAEGRYRVIDGDLIDARQDGDAPGTAYVAVCASRAKAEEKADRLNLRAAEEAEAAELAARDAADAAAEVARKAAWDAREAERVAAAEAPAEETKAYRVGKVLREWVLANDADSDLAAHIKGRNVCYDGTATLRVTAKWAQELSWLATDLENAAIKGDARVTAKAPAIMAARAAQKTVANLF